MGHQKNKLRYDLRWIIPLFFLLGCPGQENRQQTAEHGEHTFVDIAVATGIDFTYFNGMTGEFYIAEIMGGGCALFDYDNDGDLDIYLIQGNMPDRGKQPEDAMFPPADDKPLRDRLYRNDLTIAADGTKHLGFTDVTQESGIHAEGYGMGVAAGDYNNDGWVDLYVTNHGPNYLYHNNGDGSFTDVTAATGTGEDRWSTSAAFVDVDRDGLLDLYVGNYLDFRFEPGQSCFNAEPNYCHPLTYPSVPDRLFRNRGDGSFTDITQSSGLGEVAGNSLGVVTADLNGDGWVDIYVANDGQANHFWVNRGDGSFTERALLSGCALNASGEAEASMGIDATDLDGDGDEDLFMTHLAGETNTLYINDGNGFFEDRTIQSGLGPASKPFTGFGTAWLDYDNDGSLDLLVVNGAVTTIAKLKARGDAYPLHQRNQLFRNLGDGRFVETGDSAGPVFALSEVSRGSAFGDIDNDGDMDVLITNNNGKARLLENKLGNRNHWLGLALIDTQGKRPTLGARVGVFSAGSKPIWRRVRSDGSYASANDPRVLMGLGDRTSIQSIHVAWPNGETEMWPALDIDRWHTLSRGTGKLNPVQ